MRRYIFEDGDRAVDDSRVAAIYSEGTRVRIGISGPIDAYSDEHKVIGMVLSADEFLVGLGRVRTGTDVVFTQSSAPGTRLTLQGRQYRFDQVSDPPLAVLAHGRTPISVDWGYSQVVDFHSLFLDSFSVIENIEPGKREGREISWGPIERAIVQGVSESPDILHSFSPRAFEVFVGYLLSGLGFSRVRLSRYWRDGGYDLYVIYCEGDREYSAVVEVKRYRKKKVGLEIVDRLNGVRDREGADRGVVFTSSAFSADAGEHYSAHSKGITLIDYDRIVELLGRCSHWNKTPSGLWTLPRSDSDAVSSGEKGTRSRGVW